MISTIFGKTKPINYIILLVFLFGFYWFVHLVMFQRTYVLEQLLGHLVILGCLMFSIFLVNFITRRNKITGSNSLSILFYTLLIVVFPEVLLDSNAIFCSFFILLAVRRLLSLRSLKNIKLKIFDATLWIMVSSLFYDWAIMYLLLVFVAIYFYQPKNIRNWIVPFVAIFTMFIIMMATLALINNPYYLLDHYNFKLDISSDYFTDIGVGSYLFFYILIVFLSGFIGYIKLGNVGLGKLVSMRLVLYLFLIGLAVYFLKSSSDNHPILITFFPAVVFTASYVESIKRDRIKELVLLAIIMLPFIVLLTRIF
ncbi:hypothetical protein KCTC52924_01339 [Arenibacter antarcticus]|uniref:Uncharacterized protein n=1 Tax=Arenibacter antarcticus TaxID=2040469 RepID=A0ABW5VAS2_9FLAO|nr:hypothetical protein [Arenibacter sp. H213]MCM4167847.1 hypothetical protein [Arenibacter sp. H213]